jgi:hypothetical protein
MCHEMIISFERILKFKAVLFVCTLMVFTIFGCLITENISACFNASMKLLTYSENPLVPLFRELVPVFRLFRKPPVIQLFRKPAMHRYIGENPPMTAKESQNRNSEQFLELVSGLNGLFAHTESTNRPSIEYSYGVVTHAVTLNIAKYILVGFHIRRRFINTEKGKICYKKNKNERPSSVRN